jgi:hypothetical protein
MIIGTAFTLLVVPSIYMLVARRRAVAEPVPGIAVEDLKATTGDAVA